jgi:hypothetical protein
VKIILLEYVSDCLEWDKVGNNVVNEFGSLNSIIKLSSNDLMYDSLFVVIQEPERMALFAVFPVMINFHFDPANGRLA